MAWMPSVGPLVLPRSAGRILIQVWPSGKRSFRAAYSGLEPPSSTGLSFFHVPLSERSGISTAASDNLTVEVGGPCRNNNVFCRVVLKPHLLAVLHLDIRYRCGGSNHSLPSHFCPVRRICQTGRRGHRARDCVLARLGWRRGCLASADISPAVVAAHVSFLHDSCTRTARQLVHPARRTDRGRRARPIHPQPILTLAGRNFPLGIVAQG